MIVIVKRKFFLTDYDYDYDFYSVKKPDYDYDYSKISRNRLPNRLPIEGDYTSLGRGHVNKLECLALQKIGRLEGNTVKLILN